MLPLEPPRVTGLADGLVAAVVLEVSMVRVQAPAGLLERLRAEGYRVRFQDIPLGQIPSDLAEPRVERCTAIPLVPPQEATYRILQTVAAEVRIRPQDQDRRILTLPLAIVATPDTWRTSGIELAQPRITVTVRGPRNLLRDLRPERDLTAALLVPEDLAPNALHELPVRLIGPAWLESDPVKATLALSRGAQ